MAANPDPPSYAASRIDPHGLAMKANSHRPSLFDTLQIQRCVARFRFEKLIAV
jgi:hypothetical protein